MRTVLICLMGLVLLTPGAASAKGLTTNKKCEKEAKKFTGQQRQGADNVCRKVKMRVDDCLKRAENVKGPVKEREAKRKERRHHCIHYTKFNFRRMALDQTLGCLNGPVRLKLVAKRLEATNRCLRGTPIVKMGPMSSCVRKVMKGAKGTWKHRRQAAKSCLGL